MTPVALATPTLSVTEQAGRWIGLGAADDPGAGEGWLVLPPAGHGPGLLLLAEIFGVNAHMRAVALQYALAGHVVLVPDLFWRSERRIELGYGDADRQRGRQFAALLQPETMREDLRQAVATLRARPEVRRADGRPARVAALGYCLGGRLAWQAAAATDIDAAVSYYGGGIQAQLDLTARIRCPLLLHYAEHDAHIPTEAVQSVAQSLQRQGPRHEIVMHPGTAHGFNCWARAEFHAGAAAQALARTQQFLADALHAG